MCYMDDKQLERQMFSLLTWSRSLGGKQSVVFDTEGNDVTKEWEQLKNLIATIRVEAELTSLRELLVNTKGPKSLQDAVYARITTLTLALNRKDL